MESPQVEITQDRKRAEVTQHLDAFFYLHDQIVRDKKPLDERMIRAAHRILMGGLIENAGKWRDCDVHAGHHLFPIATYIPAAMANFIARYNQQAQQLATKSNDTRQLDSFYLATQISYEFVAIHPFVDGNGRLSRLLLNVALLAAGVPFCVALGFSSGHKKARAHYFRCIQHACDNQGQVRQLASVVLYSYCAVAAAFFETVRLVYPDYYPL